MSRSHLRRLGLVIAALLATTSATVSPAHAAVTIGTIAGTITDNGVPVADAVVSVSSEGFFASARTGADGRYEVPEVPAATSIYRVSIEAPGHPQQFAFGRASWETADLFSVAAGQTTTVDDSLLPTGTITGRLTDVAGNGVSAWVDASGDNNGPRNGASTAPDGSFSFAVLPGTYRIAFQYGATTQYAYGTTDYSQATVFPVAVGQTVTVNDVKLVTGSVAGHVTNADGTPAANVTVQAQGDNNSGYGATDDLGAYRIDDLQTGSYRIVFQLPSGSRQWAHQARTFDAAQSFTVAGDAVTTVDEQLLPTGSIAGRFTDSNGTGMADVSVSVEGYDDYVAASTDADGAYRIDGIFVGTYKVHFQDWASNLDQYAFGRTTAETADPITVAAGRTVTVDDRRLPTGGVRLTAEDGVTGAAISNFYATIGQRNGSTTSGSLVFAELAVGTYSVAAGGDDYPLNETAATVTVVAGQQTDVRLTLRPFGRITTKIIDNESGGAVAGLCVFAVKPTAFTFPEDCHDRSDAAGAVTLRVPDAGAYNLFVLPDAGRRYGAQWVGSTGGTGSQANARSVSVAAGHTTSVPKIKLDRRGTIAGTVTSATGHPVQHGLVGIVSPDLGRGADLRYSPVGSDGSYTIDWLGPYEWPLLFMADDHAHQWSGAVGNRLAAKLVRVKPGKTTSFNHVLKQGTDVTVTIPGETDGGRVVIHNATTADAMGVADSEALAAGTHVWVIGPQDVKVECQCGQTIWYGGSDFDSARTVAIPATGTFQITFMKN